MLENLNNLIHSGRNYLVAAEVDPAGMAELFFREPESSQVTRESVSFAPFILLAVQMINIFAGTGIAEWPFWALIGLVPAGFLIRNQRSRNLYFRAKTKLEQLKVKLPQAVLFRCTCREIAAIAAARSDGELRAWLIERIRSTQRFKIIGYRFLREIADETE